MDAMAPGRGNQADGLIPKIMPIEWPLLSRHRDGGRRVTLTNAFEWPTYVRWIIYGLAIVVLLVADFTYVPRTDRLSLPTAQKRFVADIGSTYVMTYLTTNLFPREHDHVLTKIMWFWRDNLLLGWEWAVSAGSVPLLLLVTSGILFHRHTTKAVVASLLLVQTANFAVLMFAIVFSMPLLWATAKMSLFLLQGDPGWWPGWSYYPLLALCILRVPGLIVSALKSLQVSALPAVQLVESFGTLGRVAWPYIIGLRAGFVDRSMKGRNATQALPTRIRPASLLLVSDMHVAANDMPVIDSDGDSAATLRRLGAVLSENPADALVLVGDITDTGHWSAWVRVACALRDYKAEIHAIPGNHDVHFAGHNTFLPLSPSYPKVWIEKSIDLVTRKRNRRRVVRIGEADVLLVLLDSNGRANSGPITNAIGLVGTMQLNRARKALKAIRRPQDKVVMVVHHHVLLPPGGPEKWFLRCLDAKAVLEFAEESDISVIVTGHLHDPFVTQYGPRGMMVISCGSLHHPSDLPLSPKAKGSENAEKETQGASAYLLRLGPDSISAELIVCK
jgi:predicted phosphodiesterase